MMAIKYKSKNLRIADFCPAKIWRPVGEVKVIAPHFFLHGKHKKERSCPLSSDVLIWTLTNTYVIILLPPCSPKHWSTIINTKSWCSVLVPRPHLVCWCVILLGFFKNGNKLKILRVFPSPPPLESKGKREGRREESKNRKRYKWSAHETQKSFCCKASRVHLVCFEGVDLVQLSQC